MKPDLVKGTLPDLIKVGRAARRAGKDWPAVADKLFRRRAANVGLSLGLARPDLTKVVTVSSSRFAPRYELGASAKARKRKRKKVITAALTKSARMSRQLDDIRRRLDQMQRVALGRGAPMRGGPPPPPPDRPCKDADWYRHLAEIMEDDDVAEEYLKMAAAAQTKANKAPPRAKPLDLHAALDTWNR